MATIETWATEKIAEYGAIYPMAGSEWMREGSLLVKASHPLWKKRWANLHLSLKKCISAVSALLYYSSSRTGHWCQSPESRFGAALIKTMVLCIFGN